MVTTVHGDSPPLAPSGPRRSRSASSERRRFRTHPVLEEVAREHGAAPRQVALAFLLRKSMTFTIPKASTLAHVEENAGAGKVGLTSADIERIDLAFPAPKPLRRNLPMF
jgi:aryl-alcohol dehydrogenase-like predicted oxidoreductase